MKTISSFLIAGTLIFALQSRSVAVCFATPNYVAPSVAPTLRSESQIRSEASRYDAAIREISNGATVKLDTVEDVKAALVGLERAIPNIRFSRSKYVALGLDDSTFVNAVKERARDQKSAEAFAQELATDRNSILKLNGAISLQSRLRRAMESDATLLKSVGARLKKSADDLKAKLKANHARQAHSFVSASIAPAADDEIVLTTIFCVAFMVSLPLLLAVVVVGAAPISAVITAVVIAQAVSIVARVVENVGTDEGKDRVAKCQDAVDAAYKSCKAKAAQSCCGLDAVQALECYQTWLFDSAVCIFI